MDQKAPNETPWRRFVLLADTDVPRSGSRTEIVVNPSSCLRVEARADADGRLELRLVDSPSPPKPD